MARLNRNAGEDRATNRLLDSPTNPSSEVPIPDISEDLINYLNAVFPNTLPPDGSSYEALVRAWARREVIAHLIRIKEQNEQDNKHVLRRIIPTSSAGGSSGSGPSGSDTGSAGLQ
jgi:hypothetical protein